MSKRSPVAVLCPSRGEIRVLPRSEWGYQAGLGPSRARHFRCIDHRRVPIRSTINQPPFVL